MMTRQEFIQRYILTRSSHKRDFEDLLKEAQKAYEFSLSE